MLKKQKIADQLSLHTQQVEKYFLESGLEEGVDYHFDGIFLQGSQNYGTNHENSDVDSKYALIPSWRSMLRGINFTKDLDLPNGEKVSIKTVPEWVRLFFKGNVTTLEMLFTEHYISNTYTNMIKSIAHHYKEEIAKAVQGTMSDAIIGMMLQKRKSMFRGTATTQPEVERLGYDPKDVQHILRLDELYANLFLWGRSFEDSLRVSDDLFIWVRDRVYSGNTDKEFIRYNVDLAIDRCNRRRETSPQSNNKDKMASIQGEIMADYEDTFRELLEEEFKCNMC